MMASGSEGLSYVSVEIYQEDVLGVGSYGKVCKAKCGQLPCAAKLLHDTMFQHGDPGVGKYMEKFEQECQFLSSIKHPHIVQYLASMRVSQSNMPVLLMELMDESLTKFLERSPVPPPYHIQLGICHDVALALAYLHSNAIVHRDLSSNNVLIIGEGSRAKVTDFGMSKIIDTNPRMTSLTQCPGTLVYMPPEALTTPPQYSDKLDCFSHGVLTIQIITRNFPTPGDAHRHVYDLNYPNQHLLYQVPESDRRKGDIDEVEPDHTLLPIALECLKNICSERPSADELCMRLSTLKGEQRYVLSVEQAKVGTVDAAHQVQNLAMQYRRQIQQLEETHKKTTEDYHAKVQSVERELSVSNALLEKSQAELQAVKRELARKEMGLQFEASSAENQRLKQELDRHNREVKSKNFQELIAPTYPIQKDKIHPILERKRLKKGETWYLVDATWMKEWKQYVGYDKYRFDESLAGQKSSHPGPVETSTLLKGTSEELKENLSEDRNYFLLPAPAWDLLVSWYGISEGSRPIPRTVEEHQFVQYKVEIYFLKYKLTNGNRVVWKQFSRATTVAQLKEKFREIFSIARGVDFQLSHHNSCYSGTFPYDRVTGDPSWTVQDAGLEDKEEIRLDTNAGME